MFRDVAMMKLVRRMKAFFAPAGRTDVQLGVTVSTASLSAMSPPACPPLGSSAEPLRNRYMTYIAQAERLAIPLVDQALRETGQHLARDLLAKAIDLGSSKAHEFSPDIYWLVQSAALASLYADGPQSNEFAAYREHVHYYKDMAPTTARVWAFDLYVIARLPEDPARDEALLARLASFVREPNEPVPQAADIDELLLYIPRLYPDGVAIKTYEVREGTYWPDYDAAVVGFYKLLAKECWEDVQYNLHGAGTMLKSPAYIAQANLAEIQSMLTWCTRGERFCDGHWGAMIEQGSVLQILQRLAVLRAQM
jgi:hypothetical protein